MMLKIQHCRIGGTTGEYERGRTLGAASGAAYRIFDPMTLAGDDAVAAVEDFISCHGSSLNEVRLCLCTQV